MGTEMTDVGENLKGVAEPEKVEKNEKHYPTLFLSTKQLPELEGMKPGDKGVLKVEYEIKGYYLRSTKGNEEEGQYDLEIQRIGISDKSVKEDKEKKDEKETEKLKEEAKTRLKAGREY